MQQNNDPGRARILDGPLAPDLGGPAPDVLLQVKAHLQQINDDRLPIEIDLQHLMRLLQQKIHDLQQISSRRLLREIDMQHGLLRGERGDSTLRVIMKDEKLPPDREALIEAYLLGEIPRETALRELGPEQLEEVECQDEALRRDVEWGLGRTRPERPEA